MNLKKLLAGVLACCVVGGVLPTIVMPADNAVIAASAADEYTTTTAIVTNALGDVNGDGYLDARDASIALRIYAELQVGRFPDISDSALSAADVDFDDCVSANDASIIFKAYAMMCSEPGTAYTYMTYRGDEQTFDVSPNMDAPADGGFTSEEIENSPIKPVLSVSKKVISEREIEKDSIVEISIDLSELNNNDFSWCSCGITLAYDYRLRLARDEYGSTLISRGSAIKNSSGCIIQPTDNINEDGMKGLFITTLGLEDRCSVGDIVKIKFELPHDAHYGDIYKFDIVYSGGEMFTNFEDDETGKLMQAYLFTRGIYNKQYNNNFHASNEDIAGCSALTGIDEGCDGYIAIGYTPFITTTTKPTTTTTTKATTTTTTATSTSTTTTSTTTTSTSTTTTTAATTTTTSTTEPVTPTTVSHIASEDDLCNWAVNDYQSKTGVTASSAELAVDADGMYVIALSDETGNLLDTYIIDPETGIGTDSANEEVNLPQTGNNSLNNILFVVGAFMMIVLGIFAVKTSGFNRRREDE